MPTPFTHFTQSALSLRNFTQLYTALRISTHFTHFTQSSKTLGTLRTLRNLRELTYFTQLYSALRKAKILYATLRGGETLYASFTRRLRKVHLLYAHFTHTLRNFTQFNALYARPDYFTQLYAHGNLLMGTTAPLRPPPAASQPTSSKKASQSSSQGRSAASKPASSRRPASQPVSSQSGAKVRNVPKFSAKHAKSPLLGPLPAGIQAFREPELIATDFGTSRRQGLALYFRQKVAG